MPQLSRQDFELVAETINRSEAIGEAGIREDVCRDFATTLRPTNPQFDTDRFMNACVRGE